MKFKRIFVTSDTHGESERLKSCLNQSNFDYENDQLIHLGDVCDRGSDTKGVVELLLSIKNLISLRGNHDDWFLKYIETGSHPANFTHGGRLTIDSYKVDNEIKIPKTHIDFFKNQRIRYTDSQNRFFCHAGFNPKETIEQQDDSDFFWDRDLIMKAQSCKNEKLNDVNHFKQIFIGHTPTLMWKDKEGKEIDKPIYAAQVINIDTGGVYGGKISLLDITTDEHILYQS